MSETEYQPKDGPRGERCGVLLLNLGTPASPAVGDVRRYLREFLSDPRVIDLPRLPRWLLVHLIILPFRPRQSAAAYHKIWTDRGSPLLFHGHDLADKLGRALGVPVELGMRYQEPSTASALQKLVARGVERIVVLPLFPQYSAAAWASAVERLYAEARKLNNLPPLLVVPPFYAAPAFADALAATTRPTLATFQPDKVLMSFHGLPVRHIKKSDLSGGRHCLVESGCCAQMGPANHYCYRAQCYATARALAARLQLDDDRYEVCFQSRLGRTPWIEPHTDRRLQALPAEGCKRLLVVCPSFVADCLETIEEIGIRGRETFLGAGGEELRLVPCLNSAQPWVDAVVQLIGAS
ncbi:MAG: ferrochelatase [Planctomycetota bacterium]|jgi:ferrochelatase